MKQDDVDTAIDQLRSALKEYKAQTNPDISHPIHIRVGRSPFHAKEAEYLEALGAAVLAIGEKIRRLSAHGTV
jgi:hypothetical protein